MTTVPGLWGDWRITEDVHSRVVVDGVSLDRAGVTATHPVGWVAFGSAAQPDPGADRRAHMELFERASVVEFQDRSGDVPLYTRSRARAGSASSGEIRRRSGTSGWEFARSNGVAAGRSWEDACERAVLELAERDAVLRAWYGARPFEPLEIPSDLRPTTRNYRWEAFTLRGGRWADEPHVVGVFGFPLRSDLPFARGFAAAREGSAALKAALRESMQGLAFLSAEDVPEAPPSPEPNPLFHLDFFLCPEAQHDLLAWLLGGSRSEDQCAYPAGDDPVRFVDLTPKERDTGVAVVQALHPDALPLTFGDGPPWVRPDRRVHFVA